MIVVVKEPNKAAEIREIEGGLSPLQQIVDGRIEVVELINGFDLVCNEEFLFLDLEPNIVVNGELFFGTVFITKADDTGNFVSLSDSEVRLATMILNRMAVQLV
ncbi:DUF3846 domain-containing protein [Brevibacillus agri]|uniref:DUF3846 domain-containing protein n=1 Tax=Brevibacillus agri TaxID=51101 RepID=UPI0018CE9A1B|nr:DUF3846 domain-containing protein [Brevibacillus agri]MBG9564889.1 hypothetical protein [Brevibacillus agri]